MLTFGGLKCKDLVGSAGIEPAPKNTSRSTDILGWSNSVSRVEEWARPELNRRSSPCEGDVITPRPRALRYAVVMTRRYKHPLETG